MAQPWKTIDSVMTEEGILELRQRGERDFLIMIGSQVLMNSLSNRSELVLGQLGCANLKNSNRPRVLVGGLGMGYTLKAMLDTLPLTAEVTVAELNPRVAEWCRQPLAILTNRAVDDPRVAVEIADVAHIIHTIALKGGDSRYDAIVLDLYRGPHAKTDQVKDPLYGSQAIKNLQRALNPGGIVAVWGEQYDEGFEQRLKKAGFVTSISRPGRGGLRHVVFVGQLKTE